MSYKFKGKPNLSIIVNGFTNKRGGPLTLKFNKDGFLETKNKVLADRLSRKFIYIPDYSTLTWDELRKLGAKLEILKKGMSKEDLVIELKSLRGNI